MRGLRPAPSQTEGEDLAFGAKHLILSILAFESGRELQLRSTKCVTSSVTSFNLFFATHAECVATLKDASTLEEKQKTLAQNATQTLRKQLESSNTELRLNSLHLQSKQCRFDLLELLVTFGRSNHLLHNRNSTVSNKLHSLALYKLNITLRQQST